MRIVLTMMMLAVTASAQEPKNVEPKKKADPKTPAQAAELAVAYLKSTQAADGSWGGTAAGGMTGLVVTALIQGGGLTSDDPAVAKALKFIEGLVDPKEGHIAGASAKIGQFNYPTCANVMALSAADPERKKYGTIIDNAAALLKKIQWDESEDKKPSDVIYGGAGYGGGTRPDLSNTHFLLDALVAAKVPTSDPAFAKALIFISRCQNLKSEFQDQPWAGKINDGSFIYTAAGETRGAVEDDGTKPGYGSMTFAGLKCMLISGIGKNDVRVKGAIDWLAKHYSVDINPGMAPGSGGRGLYYYLLVMSKCLTVNGADMFTTADGMKHDWRKDVTASLLARQRKDGSWQNDTAAWMETNPELCTAYGLLTLHYCKTPPK
jgi:squalene-hopene/tetraprenyl-beta-curcumene cyclase